MIDQSIEEMQYWSDRMGLFTASEISKIMPSPNGRNYKKGLRDIEGAMTYIKTKLAERITMEYKPAIDFKQGEWGKQTEAQGVAAFEKFTGVKGIHYGYNNPKFFRYGDNAGGSPDWETGEGGEGADIKCPYNTSEHITNLLIESAQEFSEERWEYYCQGQMGMVMRKWKKFSAVSFDPRPVDAAMKLKVLVIYPDEQWRKDFENRLAEATEILNELFASLSKPKLFIASNDSEVNTMIVQPA